MIAEAAIRRTTLAGSPASAGRSSAPRRLSVRATRDLPHDGTLVPARPSILQHFRAGPSVTRRPRTFQELAHAFPRRVDALGYARAPVHLGGADARCPRAGARA